MECLGPEEIAVPLKFDVLTFVLVIWVSRPTFSYIFDYMARSIETMCEEINHDLLSFGGMIQINKYITL
jgi:hypothetical protein